MNKQLKNNINTETQEVPTRSITPPLRAFKRPGKATGAAQDITFLRFTFESEKTIDIVPDSYIVVGRQLGNDRQVNFDLTPFGGLSNGVSRTHAVIQVTDNAVFVRDFNSRNGTFLNGAELYPMRDYIIEDGDELRLGNIKMRVEFC